MKLSAIPIAIVLYLFCMSAQAARYEYVGNNFNEFTDETPPDGAYSSSMSVTGYFTIDGVLSPNTDYTHIFGGPPGELLDVSFFSFNDGRYTLATGDSGIYGFWLSTDSNGDIATWDLTLLRDPFQEGDLGDQFPWLSTARSLGGSGDGGTIAECLDATCGDGVSNYGLDRGWIVGNPGSWTTVVPVPAAAWLFGSALGLLGWVRARSRNN